MKTYGRKHCVRPTFAERAEPWLLKMSRQVKRAATAGQTATIFAFAKRGCRKTRFSLLMFFFPRSHFTAFPVRRELRPSKTAVVHMGISRNFGTSDFKDFRLHGLPTSTTYRFIRLDAIDAVNARAATETSFAGTTSVHGSFRLLSLWFLFPGTLSAAFCFQTDR